jgi:hypothetical protein
VPTVVLAPALARWLTAAPAGPSAERSLALPGGTVRELLDALFALHPALRSYVLDEHGTLRHHVVAFVDGAAVADKRSLADPVRPDGELFLFQALSGG